MPPCAAAPGSAAPLDHTRHVLRQENRLPELDAIRGLAALTVVLQHFHDLWFPNDPKAVPQIWKVALLLFKPLYAGAEAVMLFFVLSGFVLALPMLRGKQVPYPRFALRRFLRIAGPYWVAITFAIALEALLYAHPGHRNAWSVGMWSHSPERSLILQHYLFLGAYNTVFFNPVIWSLVHELRISLVFPLLFLLVRRAGTLASLLYAAAASATAAWMLARGPQPLTASLLLTLHYSGFFVLGTLLASHRGRLIELFKKFSPQARGLTAAGTVLLLAYSTRLVGLFVSSTQHRTVFSLNQDELFASNWLCALAACGCIVITLSTPPLRQFLVRPACHALGRISYSLYLVHFIVLFSLTSLFGTALPLWLQLPAYVALALGVGWLFCRWVEEPVIQLARSI